MEILERRPYAYRTSFPLDEARIRLPDGDEAIVLVKELGRSGLDDAIQRAKPEFVYDPRREIAVYEKVLDRAGSRHGPVLRIGRRSRVRPLRPLPREGRRAGALAAGGDRCLGAGGPLGGASPREGLARAAGAPAPLRRRVLPSLARTGPLASIRTGRSPPSPPAHERALARLAGLPAVFVHGEFYASNILVSRARLCPVDWEMAGIGPGVLDLAALATAWEGG